MKHDSNLAQKIHQSLEVSWREGIPASFMVGIVDYYVVPFALFLGATTQQIGFLVALPQLLAATSLLLAAKAVGWVGSRLPFIVRGAFLQATLLLPVAALALSSFPDRIGLLILFLIAFRVLSNLIGSAWGSLMSDYLPAEKRGQYFGGRSRIVGVAQVVGMGSAGVTLFLTKTDTPATGFFLIFLIASAARFVSAGYLTRMTDLPLHAVPGSDFTFLMFLRRFKESNFVRFVFYVASILFTTHLASPYFSVYMLRDLRLSYLAYMAIQLGGTLMSLFALPVWGRHADVVGNARVLKTTSLLVPVIPFLWFLSKNPIYLIIVEMFAGFVWGGFNLCAVNFIYDAVTPPKRVRCISYFNLINGMAIFAGATIGGFLADRLPPFLGFRLLMLMMLSGILRFLAHFVLSAHFQEVRVSSRRVSSLQLFFSVVGIRPLLGENQESIFPLLKRSSQRRTP